MASIFPKNDDFAENTTHYGTKLASYIRLRPWATAGDTATVFAIPAARGSLHSGYPGRASFRSHTGTTTAEDFCSVLWRQGYIARSRVGVVFQMNAVAGAVTTASFRWVGVTARNSGGTYSEVGQQQEMLDNTGYWFIFANKVGVAGADTRFMLLRVNAGVTTLLAENTTGTATTALDNTLLGAFLLEMTVDDSAGNPVLTCKYDGATVISFTDSGAGKITTAGRAGFGMCRDRQEAGGVNTAHVASYWELFDLALNATLVRDSWDRANGTCAPSITDGNGTVGKSLMGMWTIDINGVLTYTAGSFQLRDPGNNRITTVAGGGDMVSQIPATDLYAQARSVIFNLANPGGAGKSTGIYLRATFDSATGTVNHGYRAKMFQDATQSRVLVYRVQSAGTQPLMGSKTVTGLFGLAFGTNFKFYLSVENLGGTDPSNGTPSLKVYVNDIQVTGWGALGTGVTIGAANNLLDGNSNKILDGPAQGLLLDTSGFALFYDEWTEEPLATPVVGDADQVSIAMTDETTGKTGRFDNVYDWPVEVVGRFRLDEHRYETQHVNRILRSKKERRHWTVGARAVTDAERASLLTFWNAHNGTQTPFDFPDPEKSTTLIPAHFSDPMLVTILRNPNVHSFEIEIEELIPA